MRRGLRMVLWALITLVSFVVLIGGFSTGGFFNLTYPFPWYLEVAQTILSLGILAGMTLFLWEIIFSIIDLFKQRKPN